MNLYQLKFGHHKIHFQLQANNFQDLQKKNIKEFEK